MRASATSRISSAHLQAAQNKPDTNKTDQASPFALLVQDAAPKEAAKPAHKDAHSSDDGHNDKPSVKKDSKADASQAKPVQTAKTDKSDKSDDKTVKADKEDDAAQNADAAANQDQAAQPQPVNPQVQQTAAQAALASADDEQGGTDEIAAAGEVQDSKASAQAAQNNAPAAPITAEDQTQDAQAATGQALMDKALAAKPAPKPGTKTDTKTADIKAAKAGDAADNTAAANAADTKTDAANAALNDKAAAVHDAAARPAGADINHIAANALTAPQAQQPAQTAPMTQHVQVTAQPAPNVPALAVEIAAKSQSGARQFDIRLDPPELGRVEVRLSIDATGKASAHLSADQPQTLDLLQKDAPALTRALREAGLDVSQDGLNFSLRHQGSQDSGANNGGSRGTGRGFALAATASIDATATSAAYRSVADGRLDIRV